MSESGYEPKVYTPEEQAANLARDGVSGQSPGGSPIDEVVLRALDGEPLENLPEGILGGQSPEREFEAEPVERTVLDRILEGDYSKRNPATREQMAEECSKAGISIDQFFSNIARNPELPDAEFSPLTIKNFSTALEGFSKDEVMTLLEYKATKCVMNGEMTECFNREVRVDGGDPVSECTHDTVIPFDGEETIVITGGLSPDSGAAPGK